MSMLARLIRRLGERAAGRRRTTVVEVRDLIERGDLDGAAATIDGLAFDGSDAEAVRLSLKAEVAFRRFDDKDAERLFREALVLEPGFAEAHYGLSLVMLARGEVEPALRHAQFAHNKANLEPRFSAQLGCCHLELRTFAQAASALSRATRLDPNDKSSWNNLGIARRALGDPAGARKAFQRALEIDAAFPAAQRNLHAIEADIMERGTPDPEGAVAQAEAADAGADDGELAAVRELALDGRLDAAIDACEQLCAQRADDRLCAVELYRLYRDRGDVQSGLDALESFLARHPDDLDMVGELGKALEREGEHRRAKPLLDRALKERPDDISLLLSMADVRIEQGRFADAGELIDRAFVLEPTLHMKGRLAGAMLLRCRYAEALALVDEMLADEPLVANSTLRIRVDALTHLGRYDEALPLLDKEIERRPFEPGLRFPRAEVHLLNERFGAGWDDYAYRNLSSTKHLRMVAFPQWQGEPLAGKSILILAEQGLGDQVMFASCLPDLLALGPARVVVEAVDRVAPTLARSFPTCEVVATKQDAGLEWVRDLGPMDFFTPIGDLPRHFRREPADFPCHPGYMSADPQRVEHWRRALGALGPHPKIGVSWRGGTEQTRTVVRTMSASQLAGLAARVDAHWICLQYGDVTEGLEHAQQAGMSLHYWKEAITDLDEFAALISALDLVVTVCNTTVHYAGAVGKEVWVMSPRVPEWRYGLRFASMPWYPTSRMYRQPEDGDWDGVLTAVGRDLLTKFGGSSPDLRRDARVGNQT
jgi:tetratricopeptide (TPR) repeat protein